MKAYIEARRFFNRYSNGLSQPLNDLQVILEKYNIEVFYWEFPENVSGILRNEGGYYFIGVNNNHPETRQRFTICHELGHCILHPTANYFCTDDNQSHILEVQANHFAAELLMPKVLIKRKISELSFDEMCVYFNVSKEAMEYRLKNLNLWNLVI